MSRLIALTLFYFVTVSASPSQNAIYGRRDASEAQLLRTCGPFLSMTEQELADMVPVQGGFFFCGSPESDTGAQENNMTWNPSLGSKVKCRFTGTLFPNDQYPENGYAEVKTPSGKTQRFNYHQAPDGKKYWFESRRWYEQRILLERTAQDLAALYSIDPSRYEAAGKRAALILKRFAALYPDYIIKFDHPGREKGFYTADTYPDEVVKRKHDAWRLAKWSWWGYMDVSERLLLAYDVLQHTPLLTQEDRTVIEQDLFLPMLRFVEPYEKNISPTNMNPTTWRAQAVASNVLGLPELAGTVRAGISRMLKEQFSHDGFWKEATVSYHRQTVSGLTEVFTKLYPSLDGAQKEALMKKEHPDLLKALEADHAFRLPNGHYACLNDTWSADAYRPRLERSVAHLKTGIGYGVLGMGEGNDQFQAHLNYNGRFGHDHYAGLNLLLFGKGKELTADLGYTHTKARPWASSTAAHNLVVVNGKSQESGAGTPYAGSGNLLLFSGADPGFQVMEADAADNYSQEKVSIYKRTLIAVQTPAGAHYVADIFRVEGGERKDWILHGAADSTQQLTIERADGSALPWQKSKSLVPDGITFEESPGIPAYQYMWKPYRAYANFRNITETRTNEPLVATFRYRDEPGKGLRTWIMPDGGSLVSKAESWSVRNAAENQGRLDDYLRPSVIISRNGPSSRFAAVHAPFDGNLPISSVQVIHQDAGAVALKIVHEDGTTDYILYRDEAGKTSFALDGEAVVFDGRIAFARFRTDKSVQLKMVDGSSFAVGKRKIRGKTFSGKLLKVSGNQLEVQGNTGLAPGEILTVRHGNGRTSSFHVASVTQQKGKSLIVTEEPPVFDLAGNGLIKRTSFPFFEFPGPHYIKSSILSEGSFNR
ncbi:MAG: hypothetical protein ABS46_20745 [Cytophagaceae bacterium SCN 52-12]|nr:MAG: hypothetical protein ABS46_20745 [Cytophagaceae bacterium SCN 52-12]